jgi:hypothetical protein
MTDYTDRFAEGFPGNLGLVLPFLLMLVLISLWQGQAASKALLFSTLVGTALVWRVSLYIRYWLPSLWLLFLAVAPGALRIARSVRGRFWLCLMAVLLSQFHLSFAMVHSWDDPKGWPWDFYRGKVSEPAYIGRSYPGFERFQQPGLFRSDRQRVWFTNYAAAGHFRVSPLEAAIWEMRLHGVRAPRSCLTYLASAGCDYWVVNRHGQDARLFETLGLSFFWGEKDLVASAGPVAIYKMKSPAEALQGFDERARPGTDLLREGGFEGEPSRILNSWTALGGAQVILSSPLAHKGKGCAKLGGPKASLHQLVPLPLGLKGITLSLWTRSA